MLDAEPAEGIHSGVNFPSLMVSATLLAACWLPVSLQAQGLVESEVMDERVPDAVMASAVKAVSELGQSVVMGKYQVALDRMNPKEKERMAKQVGGLDALERRLASVPAEMVRQGVRMLSCKPQGKPQGFGVEPKPTVVMVNGKEVSRMASSQWLVLVPTLTKFKVLQRAEGQPAKWLEIESQSFQVAVSKRGLEDWTFIDGAGLTVGRLRNLYVTLPADIKFPPVHKRQVQD